MAMRALQLPKDLLSVAGMVKETFQYPENPEWSFRDDESEEIVRTIRSLKLLWPLLRFFVLLSPPLRDVF